MKATDFSRYLSYFLIKYLPGTLNLSENTIASYRDTFKLFLSFWENRYYIRPEKLTISMISYDSVLEFLEWIECERKCSISTRNQRLSALHSFFRYVQIQSPENIFEIQRILSIPVKKSPRPFINFLTLEEVEIILAQPDTTKKLGRRDLTLLALMYDSGARVQEVIDLQIQDIRLYEPIVVNLHGKGNKYRSVPLMKNTGILLKKYIDEQKNSHNLLQDDCPLFLNQRKQKLTRKGVAYILDKYVNNAYNNPVFIRQDKITCHVLRHSRASHMLQAGIPLIYIRDFLGHSSVTSTEIYARLDNEIKRKAIEKAFIELNVPDYPSWHEDADLMDWLTNLI